VARIVLGIVDGLHDAGAALVRDGRLLAAANEERFTRVKLQGGFPTRSIASVLAVAGIRAQDVDVVAVGGCATPTVATRMFRPLQALYAPSQGICFDRPWHPVDRIGDLVRYRLPLTRARSPSRAGRVERRLAEPVLRRSLPAALRKRPLQFVDHHLAHAESAWRTSGDGRWLVVTADAHGDGRSLTAHLAEPGGGLVLLEEAGVRESLGAFYSLVTRQLGLRPGRHEGKVLGLAARGDADAVGLAFPFHWAGERLAYDGRWGLAARHELRALAAGRREDVAAWVQRGTERILLDGVARLLGASGARQVALAGGVFANVRVNGLVAALDGVDRIHVFPHMGDGGLAAGAALHVDGHEPVPMGSPFLGPAPTPDALRAAVARGGLPAEAARDPDGALVDALAAGQPVVRYVGAMEFGPRALGHRSVLAPADRPEITDPLNGALRREEFMPFAPLVCHEEGAACFSHFDVAAAAARFMTVALPAREAFRNSCPAAVHVDGTARPQAVKAGEAPDLHDLLARYTARTGLPGIVNTSFNLHEEPIVNTPAEAMRAFCASGLPVMRLGPFVVRNPDTPWRPRKRAATAAAVRSG
jgi:carbamoyltransferase